MSKLKTLFFSLFTSFLLIPFLTPAYVLAANPVVNPLQQGACNASGQVNCTDAQSDSDVSGTVKNIINLLSVVVGIVAVIMIIVGGLRYITSGGASDKVASAKNTLLYAIIGLVVVALAQVIVRFVLHTVTTADNTKKTSYLQIADKNIGLP